MAEEENTFIESFGVLDEKIDLRDYKLSIPVRAQVFPDEFELKMCDIKNQGSVGSCVAHALAETVEYHNKIQDKITKKVSVGFIYGNRRNSTYKGSGMYVREALANLLHCGDVFLSDFKENKETPTIIDLFEERFDILKEKAYPNRITKYFRVESDDDIKYALMNYGPVVFAMYWRNGIKVNAKGIMQVNEKEKITGGHCMVIYGWDKNGWKIQNSWGIPWGKKGRAILPYEVKKNEAWCVTDEVSGEHKDIKEPSDNKFIKLIIKFLNWLLNMLKKR